MNIFTLDVNPRLAARYHVDRHVVKMVTETAQILSTACHMVGVRDEKLYKPYNPKGPCQVWAASSMDAFHWLRRLGKELAMEYSYRYGKIHKSEAVINHASWYVTRFPKAPRPLFPVVMPEVYVDPLSPVESYRNLYRYGKIRLHRWTHRDPPWWLSEGFD